MRHSEASPLQPSKQSHRFAAMHVSTRLFVGISMLCTSALNQSATVAILQLIFLVGLSVYQDRGFARIIRALAVLRWLVIPILILHMIFTPGELVIAGALLPVSQEGLRAGLWLSLHIVVMFVAAMVFSRLLTRVEWVRLMLMMPVLGEALLPYIVLLQTSWDGMKSEFESEFGSWKQQRSIKGFIRHLASLPATALNNSRHYASSSWQQWDELVAAITGRQVVGRQSIAMSALPVLAGTLLWLAWFLWG